MKPRISCPTSSSYFSIGLLVSAIFFISTSLLAEVPGMINYQGQVQVGDVNFTGTGQFKFALVDTAGTTTYWSNDNSSTNGNEPTVAVSLAVLNGLFVVSLGDTALPNMTVAIPPSVFTNSAVFLRVWFRDSVGNPFEQLSPDQRIVSVGYALGVDSDSHSHEPTNLHIQSFNDATIYLEADRDDSGESDNAYLKLSQDGGKNKGFVGFIGETGNDPEAIAYTGTIENAFFIGTGASNSPDPIQLGINQNVRMTIGASGNVGIGTATPTEKLDVAGTVKATAFVGDGSGLTNLSGGSGDGHSLDAANGSETDVLFVNNAGNVGIGTTAPDEKLHVSGSTLR